MRIAIDGAQSTGKTTLFEELKGVLDASFHFIPEPSRSIAEEFGIREATDWPALLRNSEKLEQFFQREEELLRQEEVCGKFLLDSSYYLIQAYRFCFLGHETEISDSSPKYDLILYCSCDNSFEDDGFRFSAGRQRVDQRYRDVLARIPIRQFVELPVGGRRFEAARHAIEMTRTMASR